MGGGAPPAPGRPPRAAAGAGRGPPRALRRCPAAPGQLPPAPPRGPRPAADKGRRGRYSPNKVRAMAPAGAGRAARGWHWRGGAHGTAAGRARGARRGEAAGAGAGAGAAPGLGRGGTRGAEGAAAGPGAAPVWLLAARPRSVRPAASGSHLAPLGPPPAARPPGLRRRRPRDGCRDNAAAAGAQREGAGSGARGPPRAAAGRGSGPRAPEARGAAGRAAGGRRSARAPSALLRHRLGATRSWYKRKSGLVNKHPFPVKKQTQLFGGRPAGTARRALCSPPQSCWGARSCEQPGCHRLPGTAHPSSETV